MAKPKQGAFPANVEMPELLHILNPVFSYSEDLLLDRDQISVRMEASKASPPRGMLPALCKSALSEFINQKEGSWCLVCNTSYQLVESLSKSLCPQTSQDSMPSLQMGLEVF